MPATAEPAADLSPAAESAEAASAEGESVDAAPDAAGRSGRGRPAALELARICTEFRGRDVAVLDLTAITPHFDYFVLATGASRRQMVALAEEADVRMKRAGSKKLGGEGDDGGQWIVRDYGDAVLHVFTEEARDTYDLEGLWGDAERVDWRSALGLPPENQETAGPSLAVAADPGEDVGDTADPPAAA